MSCTVYIITKMTNRDRLEMVARARVACNILRQYGLSPISPVLEEHVPYLPGVLVNSDLKQLQGFWRRDKEIIRKEAHVCLWDGADIKSHGGEREYALNRYCLWKPTILLMPNNGVTVATMEDDAIVRGLHQAGKFIRDNYGTWGKRFKWRIKMLARTLPAFLWYQLLAFR